MAKKLIKKGKTLVKKGVKREDNPNKLGCNVPLTYLKSHKKKHPLIHGNTKPVGFCDRPMHLGWEVCGVGGRVCWECWGYHTDSEDDFSLHEVFGIVDAGKGRVPLDRFGIEMAPDDPALTGRPIGEPPVKSSGKKVVKKGSSKESKPEPKVTCDLLDGFF